jgi:hypothetical protein
MIFEVGVGVAVAVGWVAVGVVVVVGVDEGVTVAVGLVAVGVVVVGVVAALPQADNRRMIIRNMVRGINSFFTLLPPFDYL